MFKIGSFEQELLQEMSKNLFANQAENTYSFNKLAKAADYLNNAAELFDDVGMAKQAKILTNMLESLAQETEDLESVDLAPEGASDLTETGDLERASDKTVLSTLSDEDLKEKFNLLVSEMESRDIDPQVSLLERKVEVQDIGMADDKKKL